MWRQRFKLCGIISNQMRVGKFMAYKRTDRPIGKFFMGFGISRRAAEKHFLQQGGGFPDLYVTFSRARAAQTELKNAADGKYGGKCGIRLGVKAVATVFSIT